MSKSLRHKIANYLFHREMKQYKRVQKSVPFSEAKTIGILYDATSERDYELVKKFVKEMRNQRKDVLSMGYYDKKELPNTRFVKLGLDLFTKKSLNWHLKPQHPGISNFIKADFDILINLAIKNNFPLKYIFAKSKAKFKIGKYDKKNSLFYDMMIQTDENVTLGKFIELTVHYLNQLRNADIQKA